MGIFTFKSAKVEVWLEFECALEQPVSVVTANRHFYVATFFLWYPNLIICYLNMPYCRMVWTFVGLCIDTDIRRYIDRYDIIYLSAERFCRYLDIYRRRYMRYIGVFPHC